MIKIKYEDIYAACLIAASQLTSDQIKQMSWFGRNIKKDITND